MAVYPNPIIGNTCLIESAFDLRQKVNYTTYNAEGRSIQNGTLSSHQQLIDLSTINKGVYYIKCSNGQKTTMVKL